MAGVSKQRQPPPGYPSGGETKVEQPPQRQPPPGYPSGGETEVEQALKVIDDISDKDQLNGGGGEDDGETDRGIRIGRPMPRLYQSGYPALYDRGNDRGNRGHGQPPYHSHPQYAGDNYEGGYENQLPAYSNGPQQFYGQPPRRGNNYYPIEYRRY